MRITSFYKPKSQLLSKYIEGFYFISENDTLEGNQYWTFPSNFSLATVCLDAELIAEGKKITVIKSLVKKIDSFLFYNISKPVEVTYNVPINEVTIYFKALSICHFFPNACISASKDHIKNFEPHPDYLPIMQKILKMEDRMRQTELLEAYLISIFQFKEQEMISNILRKVENGLKVNEIAKELNISRQYINRIFFKHIGKSPADYKKIRRFRQTIISQNVSDKFISLSYENLFFDQPHFNREFKALTGVVPTVFFKNVDRSREMLWLFV